MAERELAAYLVSSAAGWDCVPLTIIRDGHQQDVTVTLTGSADQFVFQGLTKKALPSFGAGDTLSFQHTALGGHTEAGVLPDDYFVTGTAATLAGHGQFLNDVAHKQLLWDADGTGAGAAVVVATFATPQTNLHAHDILLV